MHVFYIPVWQYMYAMSPSPCMCFISMCDSICMPWVPVHAYVLYPCAIVSICHKSQSMHVFYIPVYLYALSPSPCMCIISLCDSISMPWVSVHACVLFPCVIVSVCHESQSMHVYYIPVWQYRYTMNPGPCMCIISLCDSICMPRIPVHACVLYPSVIVYVCHESQSMHVYCIPLW